MKSIAGSRHRFLEHSLFLFRFYREAIFQRATEGTCNYAVQKLRRRESRSRIQIQVRREHPAYILPRHENTCMSAHLILSHEIPLTPSNSLLATPAPCTAKSPLVMCEIPLIALGMLKNGTRTRQLQPLNDKMAKPTQDFIHRRAE